MKIKLPRKVLKVCTQLFISQQQDEEEKLLLSNFEGNLICHK